MSRPAVLGIILASLVLFDLGAVVPQTQREEPRLQQGRQGSTGPTLTPSPTHISLTVASNSSKWKGNPEELDALRARIRASIRKKEGHDIDLSSAVFSSANKNEIVVGRIIEESENKEEVTVDTDPCKATEITQFKHPYGVDDTGATVTCSGQTYKIVAVEQQ